ncbi:MAG: RNA methyltransferase [Spirochaetales bacterium]|nr:RNA methyltransferase [Spirochaetales bacterium]
MKGQKHAFTKEELERRISYYSELITAERLQKMNTVLRNRTRYISVALENIFQPHNASAVLRSCDAFGIQDVHIIENSNRFSSNSAVDMGTSQWLTLQRYRKEKNNTIHAIEALKDQGYRVVATSPHADDIDLEEFDLTRGKAVFLFGTELDGLTPEAMEAADEYVKIPMFGFVESFNISVCVALTLHRLVQSLHESGLNWHLSEHEQMTLLHEWLRNSIRKPELHDDILMNSGENLPKSHI